jgi:hypothetical protein
MSWVRAYLAMSSAMAEDPGVAVASLALAPAAEANRLAGKDRKQRTEELAAALVDILTALEEARL